MVTLSKFPDSTQNFSNHLTDQTGEMMCSFGFSNARPNTHDLQRNKTLIIT